jgi:transcriptional regulator of met regulon
MPFNQPVFQGFAPRKPRKVIRNERTFRQVEAKRASEVLNLYVEFAHYIAPLPPLPNEEKNG